MTKYHEILSESFEASLNDSDQRESCLQWLRSEDLIGYHSTLGRWLRNQGMWEESNEGEIEGMHVDDYSMMVMRETQKQLREKYPNLMTGE